VYENCYYLPKSALTEGGNYPKDLQVPMSEELIHQSIKTINEVTTLHENVKAKFKFILSG